MRKRRRLTKTQDLFFYELLRNLVFPWQGVAPTLLAPLQPRALTFL